jgi:hypothetical protein
LTGLRALRCGIPAASMPKNCLGGVLIPARGRQKSIAGTKEKRAVLQHPSSFRCRWEELFNSGTTCPTQRDCLP